MIRRYPCLVWGIIAVFTGAGAVPQAAAQTTAALALPAPAIQNPIAADDPAYAQLLHEAVARPGAMSWFRVGLYWDNFSSKYASNGGLYVDANSQHAIHYLMYKMGAAQYSPAMCTDLLHYLARQYPMLFDDALEQCTKTGAVQADGPDVQSLRAISRSTIAADNASLAAGAAAALSSNALAQLAGEARANLAYHNIAMAERLAAAAQLAVDAPAGANDTRRDLALLNLGIAQYELGHFAESRAAFERVSAPRTAVAKAWLAALAVAQARDR